MVCCCCFFSYLFIYCDLQKHRIVDKYLACFFFQKGMLCFSLKTMKECPHMPAVEIDFIERNLFKDLLSLAKCIER